MTKVTCQRAIYLPWIAYFYRMSLADVSVIMDTVEIGRGSVENKGYVVSPNGKAKLPVPVINGGKRAVRDVKIMNKVNWRKKHIEELSKVYIDHPHFEEIEEWLFPIYFRNQRYLMDFNLEIIRGVADYLGLECKIQLASELSLQYIDVTDCIISAVKACRGEHYISSFRGKDYLHFERFGVSDLQCTVHNYKHPVYEQFGNDGAFVPRLSIVDLLFNYGPNAIEVIRDSRKGIGK